MGSKIPVEKRVDYFGDTNPYGDVPAEMSILLVSKADTGDLVIYWRSGVISCGGYRTSSSGNEFHQPCHGWRRRLPKVKGGLTVMCKSALNTTSYWSYFILYNCS